AVLNPHGHWPEGAADTNVQARCIGLARMGLVAFCPDSTHVMDLPIGLCPIGLMTWNNMRALDFLQSLEDVDPERLGCTGGSGGGQQTLYLAALDSRVKAIVPAVLVSWFRRILFVSEQTHCFCNHAPGIARLTDEPELAGLFAPRPALFICATGDWTRDFPREEFPEIKHIYQLVGGEVSCVQFDKPHNYDRDSREQMYAWMNKHLLNARGQEAVREGDIPLESPAALKKLGPLPSGLVGLDGTPGYFRTRHSFNRALPCAAGNPAHNRVPTLRILRDLLGERGPCVPIDAESRGTSSAAGFRVEKVLIETEPDVRVPVWVLEPQRSTVDRLRPAVVLAHPEGKRALLENRGALVRGLLDAGAVVVAPDMRLRGELRRRWDWNCVIWGRPENGMAAHDLAATAGHLRSRAGIDPERVMVVGLGETAAMALFAAALNDRVAGVAVEHGGPLFAETRGPQAPAGILRHGDLPEFAALVAPRPMWINREGGRFRFTEQCYARFHSPGTFRRSDLDQAEFEKELIVWATGRWR
ncbi:MAG: dienelactone hydrolase family protein, partial [Verrucomicrobiia bacterium]